MQFYCFSSIPSFLFFLFHSFYYTFFLFFFLSLFLSPLSLFPFFWWGAAAPSSPPAYAPGHTTNKNNTNTSYQYFGLYPLWYWQYYISDVSIISSLLGTSSTTINALSPDFACSIITINQVIKLKTQLKMSEKTQAIQFQISKAFLLRFAS